MAQSPEIQAMTGINRRIGRCLIYIQEQIEELQEAERRRVRNWAQARLTEMVEELRAELQEETKPPPLPAPPPPRAVDESKPPETK